MLGSVQQGGDALVRLNDAFAPDPVFVDVPAGMQVGAPVLIVHWCDGASAFPRTSVRVGEGSSCPSSRSSPGATVPTAASWCR